MYTFISGVSLYALPSFKKIQDLEEIKLHCWTPLRALRILKEKLISKNIIPYIYKEIEISNIF